MADSHLPEDEIILYVLGELPVAARAKFEARMAESAELSHRVRELQEGAVALSIGSPPRRPPPQVWTNIEKAVSRNSQRETPLTALRIGWWRSGWAAATTCLVGWILYAIFMNVHHVSPIAVPRETTVATAALDRENVVPKSPLPAVSNVNVQSLRVWSDETSDLRLKVVQLEKETEQLSQLVVQQRALLAESNRIKFYHLSPASSEGSEAVTPQLSPVLQRAVFMSIGRELGWVPAGPISRVGTAAGVRPTVKTVDGVDFVDLRPPKNDAANQTPPPSTSAQPMTQPETGAQLSDAADSTIPAFVSGDKLVVALDPATVPANSSLTFATYGSPVGATEGTIVMGMNPMVVTIPYSSATPSGLGFSVNIGTLTTYGQSNFTQFIVHGNP